MPHRKTQNINPVENFTLRFMVVLSDGNDINLHSLLNKHFCFTARPGVTGVVRKNHNRRASAAQVFTFQILMIWWI